MDLELNGRCALVMGGRRGIGLAVARTLAAEGADVALLARTREPLELAARDLAAQSGRRIVPVVADTGEDESVLAAVRSAVEQLGTVDGGDGNVWAVPGLRLSLIEFPADDPERARHFWAELLGVPLGARQGAEGAGWQTHSDAPAVGVHERGRGPGDSFSLPYFVVSDLARALERVGGARRERDPPGRALGRLQGQRGKPVRARPERAGTVAPPSCVSARGGRSVLR